MSDNTNNEQPEAVEEVTDAATDTGTDASTKDSPEQIIEQLQKQLEEASNKAQEQSEAALRARAEQDNIRRRAERDVENAHKYALEGFVESLIPVMDSLEQGLALETTNDESASLKQGMELTLKMKLDVLSLKNVVQIDPVGENFNPELHEAMSMQENPDLQPNEVIAVFQKGYSLNGRLVRPARVVVNKATAPKVDEQA